MGSRDMNHLEHLETIALADVNMLHYKESTYKGSWKAAGGRSAWFMARRNLDRLLTMMKPKEFPAWVTTPDNVLSTLAALRDWAHYDNKVTKLPGSIEATMLICQMLMDRYTAEDIFLKIAEKPKGEDGTVLAIVRDARRYFMLVEAEMIAEGVVEPEILPAQYYERPVVDAYQMIADEQGLDREEVKRRVHELFYGGAGYAKQPVTESAEIAVPAVSPAPPAPEPGPAIGGAFEDAEQQNHAKTSPLDPWQIDKASYDAIAVRVGTVIAEAFYHRRGPDNFQLEPVVESGHCPRELYDAYEFVGKNRWLMKRQNLPKELDDNYPRLQLEMNRFEHETSKPEFQFMYAYDESDQKWKLMATFVGPWGREVG